MRSSFFKTYAICCVSSLPLMLAGLVALLAGLPGRADASSLPELKLTTSLTGICRLTDSQLATALGTTPAIVDGLIASGGFELLNQGQPVSWLAGAGNTEILFHAQALQNIYTQYNVYWLVVGNNIAPATVNGGDPAAVTPNTEYYLASTNIAQSVATNCEYSLGTNPDSNYWYGATVLGIAHSNTHNTLFAIPSLAATNVVVQVNVSLCGNDAEPQQYSLSVNGTSVGTSNWLDAIATNFTFSFHSASLSSSSDTFLSTAGIGSAWLLGWFQLQYPSWYLTGNGSLVCGANSNSVVTIGGFTSANITVLDVTQPSTPLQVNNLNIQSVSGGYEVSFVPAGLTNIYSVCQAGSEQTPVDIEAVTSTGLTNVNNQAAFIIIAPTNFLTASQPLVDYRNAQGLQTKLVSMEAVYNEFNNGIRYPVAISNFLAYAWQNWSVPPKYVLFMGSGTYDYRNLLGLGGNYIPPLMVPAILNGLVASDSQYGQVTGVPGPQISIGRIPATNVTQVAQMIAKIKTYEATLPSGKAVLLSDTNDTSSGDYPADMVAVASALAGSYSEEVILPSNTGTNASLMRSDVLNDLNNGADLFVYCGHGASSQLGNAGYLKTTDVAALTDTNRSPLMSIITCLCGFFAAPGNTCIAQDLAMGTNNGAIATLAASGLSIDSDVVTLNQDLMLELVSGTSGRLGDFIQQAMSSYNQSSHYTPAALYNLLGDPTLGYVPTILTGSVILDENGNGVQDLGETTGVSPVIIQIYAGGTTLVATVTNSSNGSYGVTNLPPGNYTVVQTLPPGWLATTSTNVSVTLAAGGTTTVDFLDAQPVSIGGRGWLDVNRDGLQDSGDPGVPGVVVTLYETNQLAETVTEVTNTLTAHSGLYLFTNLPPGIYEVGFAPPAGSYTRSPQLVGSNTNLNSAASATTGLTYFFTMLSGQSNVSLNSGFEINSSPVSIVALGAYVNQGEAFVTWQTYDEVDMLAFYVTRSAAGSPVQNITPDYVLATGQDLGETYSVPDAGAALPGVYTYTLYGISSNLSVAQLDSVTVQLAPPNVSVSALTISSLTITGGNALLGWTGGQPPYVVEQSATLGAGAVWQAVGPAQTGTQLLVPLTNQASFFRVSGGQ